MTTVTDKRRYLIKFLRRYAGGQFSFVSVPSYTSRPVIRFTIRGRTVHLATCNEPNDTYFARVRFHHACNDYVVSDWYSMDDLRSLADRERYYPDDSGNYTDHPDWMT